MASTEPGSLLEDVRDSLPDVSLQPEPSPTRTPGSNSLSIAPSAIPPDMQSVGDALNGQLQIPPDELLPEFLSPIENAESPVPETGCRHWSLRQLGNGNIFAVIALAVIVTVYVTDPSGDGTTNRTRKTIPGELTALKVKRVFEIALENVAEIYTQKEYYDKELHNSGEELRRYDMLLMPLELQQPIDPVLQSLPEYKYNIENVIQLTMMLTGRMNVRGSLKKFRCTKPDVVLTTTSRISLWDEARIQQRSMTVKSLSDTISCTGHSYEDEVKLNPIFEKYIRSYVKQELGPALQRALRRVDLDDLWRQ